MNNRFVIDTVAFINYFNVFFGEKDFLSRRVREIITRCFDKADNRHKLIIPSIVLVEIFKKFIKSEEASRRFYYEVYSIVKESEDVEIKPLETEVIKMFYKIDPQQTFELHDKIIYASAIQLECPLISNDSRIMLANKKSKLIKHIIF